MTIKKGNWGNGIIDYKLQAFQKSKPGAKLITIRNISHKGTDVTKYLLCVPGGLVGKTVKV